MVGLEGFEYVFLTDDLRRRQAKDQRGRCFFCSLPLREDMTWEHLVARHHGGDNRMSNLRVAHSRCNSLVGVHDARLKHALADIGHLYGSDAFFLLADRLKSDANPHGGRRIVVKRPKRPSPRIHRDNVERLLTFLPEEMLLAA